MTNRSRFDVDEGRKPPTGEDLDHTPLTWGRHAGRTPSWVAENDPEYLVWMYESVANRPPCSQALYKSTRQDLRDDSGPEYPDETPMFGSRD